MPRSRPSIVLTTAMLVLLAGAPASTGDNTSEAVARVAARYLRDKPRLRREDCSGLVLDVLRDAGIEASGGTKQLWLSAERQSRTVSLRDDVRPGDIVFFDRTYDNNRNGRVDDTLTHVAVVVAVDDDGLVRMAHRATSSIDEITMDLRAPHDAKRISALRRPGYGSKDGPRLAGQLYRGHARPSSQKGHEPVDVGCVEPMTVAPLVGSPPPSMAEVCALCAHAIFR